MVEILREKASREGLVVEVRRADFRTLSPWRERIFDAVICSGNSLTLLEHIHDIKRALGSMVARSKRPGGVVVIGMHNYLYLQQKSRSLLLVRRLIHSMHKLELVIDLRQFGSERATVTNLFLARSGWRWRLKTYTKSYLLLPPEELRNLMYSAGLERIELRDVTGQKPYDDGEWVLAAGYL
jgi:hypothetical protein